MPSGAEVKTLGDATGDQRSRLRALIAGKAVSEHWRDRFYASVRRTNGLTRRAAADALLYLETLADAGQSSPTHATPAQGAALAALRESRVIPKALAAERMRRLTAGQLTYDEADRAILEWLRLPLKAFIASGGGTRRSGWTAPDGYFVLLRPDGSPRCYRIHTLPASGARVVHQITGDRASQRTKLYGYQATEVMRAIAENPAEAARLYARTRGRCAACNQPIHDETKPGFGQGFGPDCWEQQQQKGPQQ